MVNLPKEHFYYLIDENMDFQKRKRSQNLTFFHIKSDFCKKISYTCLISWFIAICTLPVHKIITTFEIIIQNYIPKINNFDFGVIFNENFTNWALENKRTRFQIATQAYFEGLMV